MGSRAEHFRREFRGKDVDASLLLLQEIGFVAASDPRFLGTVAAVEKRARNGCHNLPLYRPRRLRRPDSSLHRMHVVVRQRPRCYRTSLSMCFHAETISDYSPRMSIRRQESCGAIFLKPTQWSV